MSVFIRETFSHGNLFQVIVNGYSFECINEIFTSLQAAEKFRDEALEEGCYGADVRVWNGKVYDNGSLRFEELEGE